MKTFLLFSLFFSVSIGLTYIASEFKKRIKKDEHHRVAFSKLDFAMNIISSSAGFFLSLYTSFIAFRSIFESLNFQEGLSFWGGVLAVGTANFIFFYNWNKAISRKKISDLVCQIIHTK